MAAAPAGTLVTCLGDSLTVTYNERFSREDRRVAEQKRDNAWVATPTYRYRQCDWLSGTARVIEQWIPGPL
jgi:hypothetical protein